MVCLKKKKILYFILAAILICGCKQEAPLTFQAGTYEVTTQAYTKRLSLELCRRGTVRSAPSCLAFVYFLYNPSYSVHGLLYACSWAAHGPLMGCSMRALYQPYLQGSSIPLLVLGYKNRDSLQNQFFK